MSGSKSRKRKREGFESVELTCLVGGEERSPKGLRTLAALSSPVDGSKPIIDIEDATVESRNISVAPVPSMACLDLPKMMASLVLDDGGPCIIKPVAR